MSVQIVVQVPAPAGDRWKTTDAMVAVEVAEAVRFTVPSR